LLGDPFLDVAPAVAQVSTDAESGWTVSAVAPRVDGGDGYSEIVGEFLDGK